MFQQEETAKKEAAAKVVAAFEAEQKRLREEAEAKEAADIKELEDKQRAARSSIPGVVSALDSAVVEASERVDFTQMSFASVHREPTDVKKASVPNKKLHKVTACCTFEERDEVYGLS